jgi:uncharacterized cupredoxin-like copper-binding protein/predicted ester cyclase
MHQSTTRRSVVAAALVSPLAATQLRPARVQEATPAAADVEAIVRAFYEPFNTGDTSVYDTILAEDWADHPLGMGQQPGRAGFPPVIAMFRAIFPDLHVTNDDVIVCGDKATVRSTNNGTHSGGDLLGIPPTGKPVQFMAIDIHRLENGQIVETWHIEDFLSVLFQLGAVIQPGTVPAATPASATGEVTATTVEVKLAEMTITPSLTTFTVGQPYAFVVTNVGQTEHEMVIERRGDIDKPLEVNGQESEAPDIEPGKTKTLTWTFTEPGEYQLACHIPGHYEAGMVTPIEVTA